MPGMSPNDTLFSHVVNQPRDNPRGRAGGGLDATLTDEADAVWSVWCRSVATVGLRVSNPRVRTTHPAPGGDSKLLGPLCWGPALVNLRFKKKLNYSRRIRFRCTAQRLDIYRPYEGIPPVKSSSQETRALGEAQ